MAAMVIRTLSLSSTRKSLVIVSPLPVADWKNELHRRAPWLGVNLDRAAVPLAHAVGDAQPEAGVPAPRGEERLYGLLERDVAEPAAGAAHLHGGRSRGRRRAALHLDDPALGHRLGGVLHDTAQGQRELVRIGGDPPRDPARDELDAALDAGALEGELGARGEIDGGDAPDVELARHAVGVGLRCGAIELLVDGPEELGDARVGRPQVRRAHPAPQEVEGAADD